MSSLETLSKTEKSDLKTIAKQILELEGKISQFKRVVTDKEKEAFNLRKVKISGGRVNEAQLKKTSEDLSEAKLNLEAAEQGLQELNQKLRAAFKQEFDKQRDKIFQDGQSLKEEHKILMKDFVKKTAELRIMQIQISGLGIHGVIGDGVMVSFHDYHEYKQQFTELVKEGLNNCSESSYYKRICLLDNKRTELRNKTVDSAIKALLEEVKKEGSV